MPPRVRLAAILFVARSGSTLLASWLARRSGVAVTLESDFIGRLLDRGYAVIDRANIDAVLRTLYEEVKFRSWGVDRADLSARMERRLPASISVLIEEILGIVAGRSSAELVVLKGTRFSYVRQIMSMFPDFRFLFLVRDPRAVAASQRDTRASTGIPLGTDVIRSALGWRSALRRMRQFPADRVRIVRYEDMILDTVRTLEAIDEFLGLAGRDVDGGGQSSYFDLLPTNERHMHANVAEDNPRIDRVSSWETLLPPGDVAVIECLLRREMRSLGYEPRSAEPEFGRAAAAMPRIAAMLAARAARKTLSYGWRAEHRYRLKDLALRSIRTVLRRGRGSVPPDV